MSYLRRCPYCQQLFPFSLYRPQQRVCSQPDCQRRRHRDYHRRKLQTDLEYRQVVRDSCKKWRAAHPGYQKHYWQTHPQAAERNRQAQQRRDHRRRLQHLVKNTLAWDLKRSNAEVWLVGRDLGHLVKNNLASSQVLIFQDLDSHPLPPGAS